MAKSAHPETDQGSGALQEGGEVGGGFFVAHQQLAKPVEPTVRAFDHPAPGLLAAPPGADFLPALPDVRRVTPGAHRLRGRSPAIGFVRAQVLPAAAGLGTHDDDAVQGGRQQFDVMPVGPADDEGQRDATPRPPAGCACCPFFPRSVGLWPTASCAKGALPRAPSMLCHSQAMPSMLVVFGQARPPQRQQKIPAAASVENGCEWHWRCQSSWAGLSTGSPCGAHKRSRQKSAGSASACARRPAAAGSVSCAWDGRQVWAPRFRPAARGGQTLPKIAFWPCPQHKNPEQQMQCYLRISSKSRKAGTALGSRLGCFHPVSLFTDSD